MTATHANRTPVKRSVTPYGRGQQHRPMCRFCAVSWLLASRQHRAHDNESMNKYDHLMSVERVTVSLESDLASAVREAADDDSLNISAWFADAARRRLASRGLRDVIADWEAEHGTFSEEELDAARSRLSQ